MRIDTHHARLPLRIGEAAHLRDARDTRLTSLRGIAWVTIDGDRRDIVLEPGDSFVVDSDARVVVYPLRAGHDAEFALAVADSHQRHGVGRAMLQRLMQHAREHGVRRLVGDVLWDNAPMLAMVRALGGKLVASADNVSVLQARFDVATAPRSLSTASDPPRGWALAWGGPAQRALTVIRSA